MQPTITRGMKVMMKPQITHHIPVELNTVSANPAPELIPTEARKRQMPSSRMSSDAEEEV